jgi:hypothetical protein
METISKTYRTGVAINVVLGVAATLVTLYLFTQFTNERRWWSLVGVAFVIGCVLDARAGVKVDAVGVQIRNIFRTYRLTWREVESVRVELKTVWGMYGAMEVPAAYVTTSAGQTVEMKGIGGGIFASEKIEEVVAILNERLK